MPTLVDAWPALLLLAAVLSLPWVARRIRASGWRGLQPTEQPLRIVSAMAVGTQQKVVTIDVQQGAHTRRMLLGVTPQHITLLDAWPNEVTQTAAPTAPPQGP
jgi:flagellar protein FliO/FliZ